MLNRTKTETCFHATILVLATLFGTAIKVATQPSPCRMACRIFKCL
jgi:hypothetical protein